VRHAADSPVESSLDIHNSSHDPSLVQEVIGLRFRTPFLIASGQATTSIGRIHRYASAVAQNGWGGVVTKTIIPAYGQQLKPHLWSSSRFRLQAMQNSGPAMSVYSPSLLQQLSTDVEACRQVDVRVIASLIARSYQEWQEMSGSIQETGVDALELNLSCPSPRSTVQGSLGGMHVGQDPDTSARVVEAVARAVEIPVIAKLTAHASDVPAVAAACIQAGAAGIAAINTVRGILGVDIETGTPLSSDLWGTSFLTGISGPIIRPIALGVVAQVSQRVDVPVFGIGGITTWQDAVEFFLLGASLVQLCTAVMWHGLVLGSRLESGLRGYMRKKEYESLDSWRGLALRRLTNRVPKEYPAATLHISAGKCTLCGMCITACRDGAYGALSRMAESISVDPESCQLCGLCIAVCKPQAISMHVD
jgi:dihydropyrimidine dehydrogenase (NAD+) subunit PreA